MELASHLGVSIGRSHTDINPLLELIYGGMFAGSFLDSSSSEATLGKHFVCESEDLVADVFGLVSDSNSAIVSQSIGLKKDID